MKKPIRDIARQVANVLINVTVRSIDVIPTFSQNQAKSPRI